LLLILAGLWMVFPLFLGFPLAIFTVYVIARASGSNHPLVRALAALTTGIVVGAVSGLFPESLDPRRAGAVALGCGAALVVALFPNGRLETLLRPVFVAFVGGLSMIPTSSGSDEPDHAYVMILALPVLLAVWEQGILLLERQRFQTAET
jgi:chromate transport protein ChrA